MYAKPIKIQHFPFRKNFFHLKISRNPPLQYIVQKNHVLWFIIIFANSNLRVISSSFSNFTN